MRQGQQNRRARGRHGGGNNNNNAGRKHQNPLTRSFDSNGPDQKIRGTPAHIAEKYVSLARDAVASGDRVLAENYLQHAEHYNRIIMAYREQQAEQQQQHRARQAEEDAQPDVQERGPRSENGRGEGSRGENGRGDRGDRAERAEYVNGNGANGSGAHRETDQPDMPQPTEVAADGGADQQPADALAESGSEQPAARAPARGRPRTPRPRRAPRERTPRADSAADGEQQPDFLTRPIRRGKNGSEDAAEASSPAKEDSAAE